MNDTSCSWPEQDAVSDWWDSHRHELCQAVSKYRIREQNVLNDLLKSVSEERYLFKEALIAVIRDHDGFNVLEPGTQEMVFKALKPYMSEAQQGKENE